MKTILTSQGEELHRVSDELARRLVQEKKAVYVPKSMWKAAEKAAKNSQNEWEFAYARQ